MFIELTSNDLVNIRSIDEQHGSMCKIINELYDLLGSNKPETVKYLLGNLVNLLQEHFITEETYMRENNFISFFSHKLEHDRFLEKTKVYYKDISEEKITLNLEMLKSFKKWFFNHFELNDKKLGIYLKSLNIN